MSPHSEARSAALFLAPSAAGFLLFYAAPFLGGFYYSLMDSPIRGRFVGLGNYIALLGNPVFLLAMGNTLLFGALCLPLILTAALALALALSRPLPLGETYRTVFLTPLVVPVACVSLVWQLLADRWGVLNELLDRIGLGPVDWMGSPWALGVVLVVYLWRNVGYVTIVLLAGLQAIPREYHEAAWLEGAGPWASFRRVTLIYLTPATFFVFIISIINAFKVFGETYLLAGEYPHPSIYMLQHYMNNTFRNLDYQKLTTAAIIVAVLIYLLVLALFRVERRIARATSW